MYAAISVLEPTAAGNHNATSTMEAAGGLRFDYFSLLHLGGLSELTTLGEHVRRCNPMTQLYTQEHNQQVVQAPDHRDVIRDELHGTKQIYATSPHVIIGAAAVAARL
jgi:hypothetical protein